MFGVVGYSRVEDKLEVQDVSGICFVLHGRGAYILDSRIMVNVQVVAISNQNGMSFITMN